MPSFADGLREALAKPSRVDFDRGGAIAWVLAQPHVRRALADPHRHINRSDQVPLVAGASEGRDPTTHIHEDLPERFPHPAGGTYSPDPLLHTHETVEAEGMKNGIPAGLFGSPPSFRGPLVKLNYHDAHYGIAWPSDSAHARAIGVPPETYNAHTSGSYSAIKGKKAEHSPPNLYDQPYRETGNMHLLSDGRR